jgi:hypothetical protein
MVNLHPKLIASGATRLRISSQCFESAIVINDDVAGSFQMCPVNLNISGEQQAGTALTPDTV